MSNLVGPFNQQPHAKYQVVEQPSALPGCCFLCRAASTDRKWFVDVGLQEEFYGAVYLCNACITEISETVGWSTPDRTDDFIFEIATLREQNDMLRDQIRALMTMEAAIGDYVRARGGSLDPVLGSIGNTAQLSLLQTDSEFEGASDWGEASEQDEGTAVGDRAGEVAQQSDEQRVGDIRSTGWDTFSFDTDK